MLRTPFVAIALFVCTAGTIAATDANTADQAALESIKGIGPGLSERILEARKAVPFKDWSDFMRRVRGVGSSGADKLSAAGLTVNGVRYRESVLKE